MRFEFVSPLLVAALLQWWTPARADEGRPVECVNGIVDARDQSELEHTVDHAFWKMHKGMSLRSADSAMTLAVSDENGQSVCDETTGPACMLRAGITQEARLTITIDNSASERPARFALCTE